jgi:hypothetical protein
MINVYGRKINHPAWFYRFGWNEIRILGVWARFARPHTQNSALFPEITGEPG